MGGFTRRKLGKTGLEVSPIGIGGGSGISNEDLRYAFDKGINYFLFSSDLHHFSYRKSVETIKQLCKAGSALRDRVVLATVSYISNPEKVYAVLADQFMELGIDYIDVFHWGWITDKDDFVGLVDTARKIKDGGEIARFFREQILQAQEVNEEILKRGLARYVGASFHSRYAARQCIQTLDVLMLRYNLAHLGAEIGVFPMLSGDKEKDPGIVVFNVGHEGPRLISDAPPGYPSDAWVPTVPDCYRYALSNPSVDLLLAGLQDRAEVDEALAMLEKGPFSPEECEYLRNYGDYWRTHRP
jgi:predicted aldo/keto reductase-like oxidoreductase